MDADIVPSARTVHRSVEPEDRRDDCTVVLEQLAYQIRTSLELARRDRCNALHHDLDVGDALMGAQNRVSTGWKKWLRDNCFLSVRTALLYQQLARHREEIEAEIERVGELSLRAACRLIAKPKKKPAETAPAEPDPVTAVLAGLRKLTDEQTTAVWTAYKLDPFLKTMPADWRPETGTSASAPTSIAKAAHMNNYKTITDRIAAELKTNSQLWERQRWSHPLDPDARITLFNPDQRDSLIEEFIRATGAIVDECTIETGAAYHGDTDRIVMPAFKFFRGRAEYYASLFHELIHWTKYPTRLDRFLPHAMEEIVAELGAAYLSDEFAINNSAAAYIQPYFEQLANDPEIFLAAAAEAEAAVEFLRQQISESSA
jgi:Zincin-like metallopeptidase